MSSAKFTLIGAYQFFNNAGDDLFINLDLPEGVNTEVLENNILFQGGEFEVQSANPFFIQTMIGNWSKVYYDTIDRWVKALAIDYAPLENYDRQEHWTDESDGSGTSSRRGSINNIKNIENDKTIDNDRSESITGTLDATTTDHTETKKSAFDSSNYSPYQDENNTGTVDQDTTENSTITDDTTISDDTNITDNTTITDGTDTTASNDSEHTGRVHGNIGVTTSQQMLTQELDMGYWNLYQRITDLFLREFTIPVYE